MSNWMDVSRILWQVKGEPDTTNTREKVQLGCLQRIAQATEKMALNYAALVSDRDLYKRWYEEERSKKHRLELQNRALRGQITKLKNKKQSLEDSHVGCP